MNITLQDNQWHVAGEILVDNANAVLLCSRELAMPVDLEVNFSAVTNVDTAAISLMLEWQRRAVASSSKVKFTHLPESLTSLAKLYGVTEFLSLSND